MVQKKNKIIAEVGINHNGDVEIASKLIKKCKEIGVDIVKFQKRDINLVYSKEVVDQLRDSPFAQLKEIKKKVLNLEKSNMIKLIVYVNQLILSGLLALGMLTVRNF